MIGRVRRTGIKSGPPRFKKHVAFFPQYSFPWSNGYLLCYIGGTILGKLLQHRNVSKFGITALVRDTEKGRKLESLGVKVVVGDNSRLELLRDIASQADIIFSASSNVPAAKATLDGAKKHFESTGQPTIYIHTLHRNVDLELLQADNEGYIKSYIIVPTTVYGVPTGPVVEAGAQRWQSSILSYLIPPSLARGQAGMVGQGKNVWDNVEVNELADLYLLIFDAICNEKDAGHGHAGLYFAENGTHELFHVYSTIGSVLFEHGKTTSATPTPFTEEEIQKFLGPLAALIGSNARCTANRARKLGWKPVKGTNDFLQSVREVAPKLLAGLR
ncbi:NmrA domain-containing protein [Favolaschia claudopus]|uniref:NmrA domain-containing protein n=1 Tax=Favolaschia claudopus TaxID=2862362 RepID=A0AAW0DPA0_9AGAR